MLARQIRKHLPASVSEIPEIAAFISAVNASYRSFERDKEITSHAFNLSEQEYRALYENLLRENELKRLSIERMKETLTQIRTTGEIEPGYNDESLLSIAEYLKSEIGKRKMAEQHLTENFELLTTLVSNFHSAILIKDENKKVLFANDEFCKIFSLKQNSDQLIGTDFTLFAEQAKELFTNPDEYVLKTRTIMNEHASVHADVVHMRNGKIYQRYFIPIFINQVFKGHLWEHTDITEKENFARQLIELSNVQEAILNGTNYCIIYTDTSGTIRLFNKGAENMLGYKASEVVNRFTPGIIHDADEIKLRAAELSEELGRPIEPGFDVFVEQARLGLIETREWTYISKNGRRFPVQLSVSAIRDADQKITGYMGIAHDLSDQKEAQEALKQSEERYRNIVENSSDIIYKTSISGHFTFVNPVAEKLTGYSRGELTKMRFTELIRQDKAQEIANFYREQLVQKKQSTYCEFPLITKSGEEKWIAQSVQLSLTSEGSAEFTAMAINITEKKQFETNLQRQKEKYLNIITNMNLGLVEVDVNDTILYANPGFSNLSGYSIEELIGQNAASLLTRYSNKTAIDQKIEQRKQGISDTYELPVQNKQGELRWWMISGAPNYDQSGKNIGSIGIHLDITENKKLVRELQTEKEKVEASARAQATFLANMSHEIRTPLNGIIGMIRELHYENLKDRQRRYVQYAATASEHLLSVLNNVLDISKIEAGELRLEQQHFLLRNVVQDVKSILSANAGEKRLHLGIDPQKLGNLVYIGDAARLRQILLNLVGNAIKFTSRGGVYLDCEIDQRSATLHTVTFIVEDTGIGMEEEYQANLFRKFSQEDSSVSRKYGGTGLGMAITRELIQLMDGEIKVSSRKNQGTRIDVILKMAVGNLRHIETADTTNAYLAGESHKILLVEDNEFNRMVARNTLERYGYSMDEAENGQLAVEMLKKKAYDLILMDMQMPVMDGFEAARHIRNELQLKTPIVALTANAFKSEVEQCMALGMDDYVTKPYDETKLMAVITRLINHPGGAALNESNLDALLENKRLYDLSTLEKQSAGNRDYVNKMVGIFTNQTTQVVPQLKEAYRLKDLETVYRLAHRIKPSIDGMGISSLKQVVRAVEQMAKDGKDSDELTRQLDTLCSTLVRVIDELATDQMQ